MMKKAVLPFLTIPDEAVATSPWEIELSTGRCFEDPDFVQEWDNGTNIKLRRYVEFDYEYCFRALECSVDQVEFAVLVTIGTGAGSIPTEKWITYRAPINPESPTLAIEICELGEHLADVLHIDTTVILARSVENPKSPISPVHEGSIVWQEKKRVRLEGDVSRFPVSETNLERLLGAEWKEALWYLQVDWDDPESPFDSSVRLHVNSQQQEFADRFRKGDAETVHVVMADVITQITSGCLKLSDEWEFMLDEPDGPVSLGRVAGHWLEAAFGSVEAARQAYRHTPGRFHAHLNALASQEREQ